MTRGIRQLGELHSLAARDMCYSYCATGVGAGVGGHARVGGTHRHTPHTVRRGRAVALASSPVLEA